MSDLILSPIPARPCIKCGATERNKYDACKPCAKASCAAWRSKNKDRVKANHKAQYDANPEKAKAATKAWYEANKERAQARMRAWQVANPEKVKASQKAWRDANPDKVKALHHTDAHKASVKAWQAANPEKFRASVQAWKTANRYDLRIYGQNARAKALGVEGQLSDGLIDRRLVEQQSICPCCNETFGEDFQMDHIISLYNGGLNVDANVHLLKTVCNLTKGSKNFDVFMMSKRTV